MNLRDAQVDCVDLKTLAIGFIRLSHRGDHGKMPRVSVKKKEVIFFVSKREPSWITSYLRMARIGISGSIAFLGSMDGWMDGSQAFPGFTNTSHGCRGNFCLRMRRGWAFDVDDYYCTSTLGYICERKEVGLIVPEQRNDPSSCLPTIPYDLNRLAQSGALCLYRLRDDESPPILYECESGEFIDECGCILQNNNSQTTVICSCGFCDLVVDDFQENSTSMPMLWPSNFSCCCSANGTSSNVTVVSGVFRVQDDSKCMTTLGATGVPIGIPVGVTLTLLFLLVALVAVFIWRKKSRLDVQPIHITNSDTTNAAPHTEGGTLLSDATHNTAFTGASDDTKPDQTEVGHENYPGEVTTSLQPDAEKQCDSTALCSPAAELIVHSGHKDEGYAISTVTSKASAVDEVKPEQSNPDGTPTNYVYDYAAIDNLPVGIGLSLGPHNKSPPNQSNHEPPMVHPVPLDTNQGKPLSEYDDVAVGNNSDWPVVDEQRDQSYVNQKVFAKRHLGGDKQAPNRRDAGTSEYAYAEIPAENPLASTDDIYDYAEVPSQTNQRPCNTTPARGVSMAPGQSPLNDGGYQALNTAELEGENKYTPLTRDK